MKSYRERHAAATLLLLVALTVGQTAGLGGRAQAIELSDGVVVSGLVVDRATGAPVIGTTSLTLGIFSEAESSLALWSEGGSASDAFFAHSIGSSVPLSGGVFLEPTTYLEISADASARPRVPLSPLVGVQDGKLDIRRFSRSGLTDSFEITGLLVLDSAAYDAVTVRAAIVDEFGALLQDLGGSTVAAVADGTFEIALPGASTATNAATVRRSLVLDVDYLLSSAPILVNTYVLPLTLVGTTTCIELLHLLPAGEAAPPSASGGFGCPVVEVPPPDPEPEPGDDLAALQARVSALETQVSDLLAAVADLSASNALLASRLDELRSMLVDHSHSYLTGSRRGHNNTLARTGPATFPAGPEPVPYERLVE